MCRAKGAAYSERNVNNNRLNVASVTLSPTPRRAYNRVGSLAIHQFLSAFYQTRRNHPEPFTIYSAVAQRVAFFVFRNETGSQ